MDLRDLRLFLHLSETLHFYKTSQACYISAPGLTRAIKRLEEEAGEELFERSNRAVSLTPAGRLLKEYACDMIASWQTFMERREEDRGGVRGELTLYCSVTASYMILKQMLSAFRRLHPNVQIRLQTGEAEAAVKQVLEGNADIGIAARPDRLTKRIDFKTVTTTPLVFIAGKEFQCEDIAAAPFILPAHGLSRKRLEQWFSLKKISPRVYAEVSGNEAIIAMVSLGLGIGTVPHLVMEQSLLKNDIQILSLTPELRAYEVGYCRLHRKNQRAAVKALWRMIPESG